MAACTRHASSPHNTPSPGMPRPAWAAGRAALPPILPRPLLQTLRPHPRPSTPCPRLHSLDQVPVHGPPPSLPALAHAALLAPAPLQVPRSQWLHGCRSHELRDARQSCVADWQQPQHVLPQAPLSPKLQGGRLDDPCHRCHMRVGTVLPRPAAHAPLLLRPRWALRFVATHRRPQTPHPVLRVACQRAQRLRRWQPAPLRSHPSLQNAPRRCHAPKQCHAAAVTAASSTRLPFDTPTRFKSKSGSVPGAAPRAAR